MHESLQACVYIMLCTVRIRVKGGASSNAEAMSQEMEPHFAGPLNHNTPINKVWDHFCKRKWFGVSK